MIGKDIFIVGGGWSAGQAAMFFANYASTVTVLVRGAGLESRHVRLTLIEQMKQKGNISVGKPYTMVVSAGGDDCRTRFAPAPG